LADARSNDFEDASFQHQFRIGLQGAGRVGFGPLEVGQKIVLGAPKAQGPGNVFGAAMGDHAHVVFQATA
jgi:hypothetical protein